MRLKDSQISGSFCEAVPTLRDHFSGILAFILAVFVLFVVGIAAIVFSPDTKFIDAEGAATSPSLFLYFVLAGFVVAALVVVALSVRHYLGTARRKALIQQVLRRHGEIYLDLQGVARVGEEVSGTVNVPVPHAPSSKATFHLNECHAEIPVDDHGPSPSSYQELYDQFFWDLNWEPAYDTTGLRGEIPGTSIGGAPDASEIPIVATIPSDAPAADLTHRIFWLLELYYRNGEFGCLKFDFVVPVQGMIESES